MGAQRKRRSGSLGEKRRAPRQPTPSARAPAASASYKNSWFLPDAWWFPALLVLVCLAYWPTLGADFVRWDDQFYVTENRLLREPGGLRAIWNPASREAPQFYPLVFTTYWIEMRLWGENPRGYHLVNVGLHLATTSLGFAILRSWGFAPPWAAFASAVFALHPVQVASVAWVSERKNTLAALFLMLSLAFYWRAWRLQSNFALLGSFLAFAGSLLSKTQGVALPLAFALTEWVGRKWLRTPVAAPRWTETVARLLPFGTIAALLAAVTMRYEHDRWPPLPFSLVERLLVATNALAFYVKSTLWPLGRCPIYPKWTIEPSSASWWVAPVSIAVAATLLVFWRKRLHPWAVWGGAYFLLALVPVLGFVPFNFFTYSFVGDHFLYFSMFGAGVTLAVAAQALAQKVAPALWRSALAATLVFLTWGSHQEARHWRDNLTFWQHVRRCEPHGFLANYNLGLHYSRRGQWGEAAAHYRVAALARPQAEFVFRRYAEALRAAQGPQAVLAMCEEWLARYSGFLSAHWEKAWALEQLGRLAEALGEYEQILRLAPPGSPWHMQARERVASLRPAESKPE